MSFYQVATGTVIMNADDLQSSGVTAKTIGSVSLTVTSISGKGADIEFTLAGYKYASKVSLDFDYQIGDLNDYATTSLVLVVDGLEVNGTDKIKVYLSDAAGDTDYYLGYISKVAGTWTFTVEWEKIDDKALSESADVFIVLVAYDKDGAAANGFKTDDQEVSVTLNSGGGYYGEGAIGVFGAAVVSVIAMLKRVVAGIMGAVGAFVGTLFSNSTIVILFVACLFAGVVLLIREKSIRGLAAG
jgi:hypothetical protein